MSNYYQNRNRKRRSRREKIGFYTALSICLIAVCMAVYSTYNTVTHQNGAKLTQPATDALQVAEPVTGVAGTIPMPTLGILTTAPEEVFVPPTAVSDADTQPVTQAEEPGEASEPDALQTMLAADLSLTFPVKGGNVLRPYSAESTYNKTLNVWKPHTAVDFACELGETVTAMVGGEVTKVYDDKMLGSTVEVSVNNVVITYSGLGRTDVSRGDRVETGDALGVAGTVPCEASDKNHIHVSVKINGEYADPLNFVGINE